MIDETWLHMALRTLVNAQGENGIIGVISNHAKNRPFATNNHMVHGGGQADYYSRTGTLKQRDLNQ